MIRTARQVEEYDVIGQAGRGAIFGVLSVFRTTEDTFRISTISARGIRGEVEYRGNDKLEVLRPSEGEVDETNNPYWWGMEAERERAEDARAYDC